MNNYRIIIEVQLTNDDVALDMLSYINPVSLYKKGFPAIDDIYIERHKLIEWE